MSKHNGHQQTLVTFELGAQPYAIGSRHVERVTPMAALHRPASTPKLLRGFLDLAGEAVPVICLHTLFHLPSPVFSLWTPIIILRGVQHRLAFPVDKVNRFIQVDNDAALPLPANHVFNECVEGIIRGGGDSILLLSPGRLLLEQENRTIAEFQEIAAQRISELEGAEA